MIVSVITWTLLPLGSCKINLTPNWHMTGSVQSDFLSTIDHLMDPFDRKYPAILLL